MNAERGKGRPSEHSNSLRHLPAPGGVPRTHRSATCHGTMRSALMSRLPGAVSRRNKATDMPKGGFPTTRNGRRGSRTSAPSALTTVTWCRANSSRSCSARVGCNSKAMTRAPLSTSGRVIAPVPAPMSSTRSPREMPASSTRRLAHLLSSRCHPHRVRCPGTADHRDHCHPITIRQLTENRERLTVAGVRRQNVRSRVRADSSLDADAARSLLHGCFECPLVRVGELFNCLSHRSRVKRQ